MTLVHTNRQFMAPDALNARPLLNLSATGRCAALSAVRWSSACAVTVQVGGTQSKDYRSACYARRLDGAE